MAVIKIESNVDDCILFRKTQVADQPAHSVHYQDAEAEAQPERGLLWGLQCIPSQGPPSATTIHRQYAVKCMRKMVLKITMSFLRTLIILLRVYHQVYLL